MISVGAERFQAAEALFRPELVDCEGEGLSGLVFRCIQEMDIDNRMPLYQHIVLSGGSSMYPGLPSRLEADLRARYLQVRRPAAAAGSAGTAHRCKASQAPICLFLDEFLVVNTWKNRWMQIMLCCSANPAKLR